MAEKYKQHFPDPSETPPIDIMPASNGEFIPPDPTPAQRKIMALQNEKIEEARRKFGMSRRDFVRTAAAYGIGVWAVDQVTGGQVGQLRLRPEHQDDQGLRPGEPRGPAGQHGRASSSSTPRATRSTPTSTPSGGPRSPGFMQFLLLWTSQAMGDYPGYNEGGIRGTGGGEIDPVENLGRYHYFKEMLPRQLGDGEPAHRPAEAARRGQHHAHEVGRRDPRHDQQHDPVGALLRPRLLAAQPGLPGPGQGAGLPAGRLRLDVQHRRSAGRAGLEALLRLG